MSMHFLVSFVLLLLPPQLEFRRQARCQVLCRKVNTKEEGDNLAERIDQEYTVNW